MIFSDAVWIVLYRIVQPLETVETRVLKKRRQRRGKQF